MLYSEFVEGTGCRENNHNYTVYRRLEIIYMNDDSMSKEDVYEWGKKLVDNSLTEEQKAWNDRCKEEILSAKTEIEDHESNKARYKDYAITSCDDADRRYWRECVKYEQDAIKILKTEIKRQKSVMYK